MHCAVQPNTLTLGRPDNFFVYLHEGLSFVPALGAVQVNLAAGWLEVVGATLGPTALGRLLYPYLGAPDLQVRCLVNISKFKEAFNDLKEYRTVQMEVRESSFLVSATTNHQLVATREIFFTVDEQDEEPDELPKSDGAWFNLFELRLPRKLEKDSKVQWEIKDGQLAVRFGTATNYVFDSTSKAQGSVDLTAQTAKAVFKALQLPGRQKVGLRLGQQQLEVQVLLPTQASLHVFAGGV